jgi:hypothetical protein
VIAYNADAADVRADLEDFHGAVAYTIRRS